MINSSTAIRKETNQVGKNKKQKNNSLFPLENKGIETSLLRGGQVSVRGRPELLLEPSHDARLHVLVDALVAVMELMVVGPPAARVEGREAV